MAVKHFPEKVSDPVKEGIQTNFGLKNRNGEFCGNHDFFARKIKNHLELVVYLD